MHRENFSIINGNFKDGCTNWESKTNIYIHRYTEEEIREVINFSEMKIVNMTELNIENFTEKEMIKLLNKNGKLTLIQRFKRAISSKNFKEFMVKNINITNVKESMK